jgi:hypothetical protein
VEEGLAATRLAMEKVLLSKRLSNTKDEIDLIYSYDKADRYFHAEIKKLINRLDGITLSETLAGKKEVEDHIKKVLKEMKLYKDSVANLNIDPIKSTTGEWIDFTGTALTAISGLSTTIAKFVEVGSDASIKPSAMTTSLAAGLSALMQIVKIYYRAGHLGAPTDLLIDFKRAINNLEIVLNSLEKKVKPTPVDEGSESESESESDSTSESDDEPTVAPGTSMLYPHYAKPVRTSKEIASEMKAKLSEFNQSLTAMLDTHELAFVKQMSATETELNVLRNSFDKSVWDVIAKLESTAPFESELKTANAKMLKHHKALETFVKDLSSVANKSKTADQIELGNGVVSLGLNVLLASLGFAALMPSSSELEGITEASMLTTEGPTSIPAAASNAGVAFATLTVGIANTIWSLAVSLGKHMVKMKAAKSEGAGQVNRSFKSSKALVQNYLDKRG